MTKFCFLSKICMQFQLTCYKREYNKGGDDEVETTSDEQEVNDDITQQDDECDDWQDGVQERGGAWRSWM